MAMSKPQFYGILIFIVGALALSWMLFGQELKANDILLDNTSSDYIDQYSGYISDAGIDTINESDHDYKEEKIVQDGNETGKLSVTDNLAPSFLQHCYHLFWQARFIARGSIGSSLSDASR